MACNMLRFNKMIQLLHRIDTVTGGNEFPQKGYPPQKTMGGAEQKKQPNISSWLNFWGYAETVTPLLFDKPTYFNAFSMMASNVTDAVFSQ